MSKYAFFHGEIVPIEDAKISIRTHTFNYGTGCFGGIRAYWNPDQEQLYVFRIDDHYKRFLDSCKMLLIDLPYGVADLKQITLDLLRREGFREDTYCRPLGYKSDEVIGVRLHNLKGDFALFMEPFGRYLKSEEGCKAMVSSWRRIDDNAIPARGKIVGAYVNSAFAKTEAVLNGFDEAIVLDQDGHVSEGSAMNLFIVRDGVLITPPVTDNVLEGITRRTVMTLASEALGLSCQERSIDRTELYLCDEAFFCGTGVQMAAISSVDQRPVGTGEMGPIVQKLRQLYFDVVRGKHEDYREQWCTPVYER
ncbi:MAG TPA: branched chain amino acid aminotransferase [Chloroflexi bacterium]|nr:branched chain amino acid aminotransferase [Chloroflexota bacterium]